MLDAAVIMMQQYNTTATLSSRMTQGVQSQESDNSQPQTNTAASSSNHSSKTLPTDLSSLYEAPKTVKKLSTATTSEVDSKNTTVDPTSNLHTSTSTESIEEVSDVCTSEEELRRRRLQRFQLHNEH